MLNAYYNAVDKGWFFIATFISLFIKPKTVHSELTWLFDNQLKNHIQDYSINSVKFAIQYNIGKMTYAKELWFIDQSAGFAFLKQTVPYIDRYQKIVVHQYDNLVPILVLRQFWEACNFNDDSDMQKGVKLKSDPDNKFSRYIYYTRFCELPIQYIHEYLLDMSSALRSNPAALLAMRKGLYTIEFVQWVTEDEWYQKRIEPIGVISVHTYFDVRDIKEIKVDSAPAIPEK